MKYLPYLMVIGVTPVNPLIMFWALKHNQRWLAILCFIWGFGSMAAFLWPRRGNVRDTPDPRD
jgi:hypothetical protein